MKWVGARKLAAIAKRRFALLALVSAMATSCGQGLDRITLATRLAATSVDLTHAQSYQLWVLSQVGRDKSAVQCEQLLARTLLPGDANVVKLRPPIAGSFKSTIKVDNIPTGQQDRVFFIEIYDQSNLLGTVLGWGCAQSVSIVGNHNVSVELVTTDGQP